MQEKIKETHVIDTRFTMSGPRAKELLELVKEEFGLPLPYGAVNQFIRLACIYYLEARKRNKIQENSNNG